MHQTTRHIQSLVDQVEENLSDEINIITLADSFHVSAWHFQRTFKALVGDTLGGYIRGRRLTEAARLLTTTDLDIIDVAFSVGFSSHEAFSRSFKLYFGQSPKDFRKYQPTVVLNEKPLLDMEHVRHLEEEIDRDPIVMTTPEQTIIGITTAIPSPFLTNDAYCESLWPAWMTLLDRQDEIKERQSGRFYGITASPSGTFTEDTLNFIAGVSVASVPHIPTGMVAYTLPEQGIARFNVESVDIETTLKTINYIYGYWLPNSPYTRGSGSDYEVFEEADGFINPGLGSQYVIPIIPKS